MRAIDQGLPAAGFYSADEISWPISSPAPIARGPTMPACFSRWSNGG